MSARLLAEAAAHDGYAVSALDLFGDADTRRAAQRWLPIGERRGLRIDGDRFLAALAALRDHDGWVAGSGFEGRPELLARAAAILPLVGTAPDAVAAVRDPAAFFGFLRDADIDHPPVLLHAADADDTEWLLKDSASSGGQHIRRWHPGAALARGQYLQRAVPGQALSATIVGNGSDACVLGINRQIVRAFGGRPYVVCGVVGPLPADAALLRRLTGIARSVAARFALRGLASIDFIADDGRIRVLEVNPRPPASLASYGPVRPLAAHVRACLHGELPPPQPAPPLTGHAVVFAERALALTATQAAALAAAADVHDLPAAGQTFAAGDPLCSISAAGGDADDVSARLQQRRDALLRLLETDGP